MCEFLFASSMLPYLVKHNGDLSLDSIIKIARIMRPRSMARKLEGTVKEILGNINFSET